MRKGTKVKPELKWLHSPDVGDLEAYQPDGAFGFLLQMMIGPEGSPGEESFDTIVCSPEWLADHSGMAEMVGEHQLVMEKYDYTELRRLIETFCHDQEADTWQEIGKKLGKLGRWEFADYREYKSQPSS